MLDFHIADNASKPAIVLFEATDFGEQEEFVTTLPIECDDLAIAICDWFNGKDL